MFFHSTECILFLFDLFSSGINIIEFNTNICIVYKENDFFFVPWHFFYGSITFFHSIIHGMSIYSIVRHVRLSIFLLFFLCVWWSSTSKMDNIPFILKSQSFFFRITKKVIVYVIVVVNVLNLKPSVYPLNIYEFQDYFLFNLIALGWATIQTVLLPSLQSTIEIHS